jgi:hypothetical protein
MTDKSSKFRPTALCAKAAVGVTKHVHTSRPLEPCSFRVPRAEFR